MSAAMRHKARLRTAGLCVASCGRPAVDGRTLCGECNERARARMADGRKRRRSMRGKRARLVLIRSLCRARAAA